MGYLKVTIRGEQLLADLDAQSYPVQFNRLLQKGYNEEQVRNCDETELHILTLKAPIATKVVCLSCLLKCLRNLYDKQCGPRLDWEQSDLGPSCLLLYLNSSVMLDNHCSRRLQQTAFFRFIFSWRLKG